VNFQVVQSSNDCGKIACTAVLFIVGKPAEPENRPGRYFIADVFDFSISRGAKGLRCFFDAGKMSAALEQRPIKANLLRLTDNFDRNFVS